MSASSARVLPAPVPITPTIASVVISEVDEGVVQPKKLYSPNCKPFLPLTVFNTKSTLMWSPINHAGALVAACFTVGQPTEIKKHGVLRCVAKTDQIGANNSMSILQSPHAIIARDLDRHYESPKATEDYKAWPFLKENCNPDLSTMNWTQEMLKGWLEKSSFVAKKPLTMGKVPLFPPLSFLHKPYQMVCMVVNDVFAVDPELHCPALSRARIPILHMLHHSEEEAAGKCWDEVEFGTCTHYVTPLAGQFVDLNFQPRVHECGFLRGFEFCLLPQPCAALEPTRKKRRSVLQL